MSIVEKQLITILKYLSIPPVIVKGSFCSVLYYTCSVFYIIVCLFALILDGQSSIQREFEPDFVNYKVDQLLAHGRWFSPSTPGFFHH